ncbi:MAG TPA: glutathione S-transferase family protein [Caulobacteraceae bacterium]|jgi:glutathione S-transferase|nr:glutathione S-transferase family protein [Caulobacteraceae bacterium]
MSDFIVHSIPGSPFGRSVMAVLEEKGAPWRLAPIAPGALKTEPHISRHPFGRMPVLDHGGFSLYETSAILRYLDRILPTPALTPADPKAAARMDQVMSINDWYLFQGVGNVIGFQRVVGPRLMGLTPNEDACTAALPPGRVVFRALGGLLGDRPYFGGGAVSLADFMVAPQMDFLAECPEWATLCENAPQLCAWLERMNARPSLQATTWPALNAMATAA